MSKKYLQGWHKIFEEDYEKYKDHPQRKEAEALTDELTKQVIQSLPWEDRKEAQELLTAYGWPLQVAYSLVRLQERSETSSPQAALEQRGRDKFLNREVEEVVSHGQVDAKSFQNTFEIISFSNKAFLWKEVEIENNIANLTFNIPGERVEKNAAETAYGQRIQVQQYAFKVDRSEDTVTVTCFTGESEPKWMVEFPLTMPFDEAAAIYKDENADFRKIQPLLNMSFKKFSSN